MEYVFEWETVWFQTCDATMRYRQFLSADLINAMFTHLHHLRKNMILMLKKETSEHRAYDYYACLIVEQGRLPNPESYTFTAVYGTKYSAMSWTFAARRQTTFTWS